MYSARFSSDRDLFCRSVTYPSMAASGVLNSWETFSMKSFRKISVFASSFTITLKLWAIELNSVTGVSSSTRTLKFPFTTSFVASLMEKIAFKGRFPAKREKMVPRITLTTPDMRRISPVMGSCMIPRLSKAIAKNPIKVIVIVRMRNTRKENITVTLKERLFMLFFHHLITESTYCYDIKIRIALEFFPKTADVDI